MKKSLLAASIVFVSVAIIMPDAEAKRFGGGRSIGTQRSVTTVKPAQPPAQQAQPAAGVRQSGAPAAAPAAGGNRWMPILGGLALGGVLGTLFGGSGIGGLLLLIALVVAGVFAFRAYLRFRAESGQSLRYVGLDRELAPAAAFSPVPGPSAGGGGPGATPGAVARIPAGFDVAGFLRAGRLNFMRLQVANDLGRWDEIREFTTPELFASLQQAASDREAAPQQTDIVNLKSDLLEVVTEGDTHWASLRFSGMVREAPGEAPVAFEEIWNLSKPADGSTGWLLSGIQQPD